MTDKMREEFETWAVDHSMALHLARSDSGLYASPVTQKFMDCWQASRESLVIELPKPWQTNVGAMMTPNGVKFAIESAGLKYTVKP